MDGTQKMNMESSQLDVISRAFTEFGSIPEKYTCHGANVNPPLGIRGIPPGSLSLALIMDDPDAPIGPWVHWIVWNIPVRHRIRENYQAVVQGLNDFGRTRYTGPCPLRGTHRYCFAVYALDCLLGLSPGSNRMELERAMYGHIIASGKLTGLYPGDNGRISDKNEIFHQKI